MFQPKKSFFNGWLFTLSKFNFCRNESNSPMTLKTKPNKTRRGKKQVLRKWDSKKAHKSWSSIVSTTAMAQKFKVLIFHCKNWRTKFDIMVQDHAWKGTTLQLMNNFVGFWRTKCTYNPFTDESVFRIFKHTSRKREGGLTLLSSYQKSGFVFACNRAPSNNSSSHMIARMCRNGSKNQGNVAIASLKLAEMARKLCQDIHTAAELRKLPEWERENEDANEPFLSTFELDPADFMTNCRKLSKFSIKEFYTLLYIASDAIAIGMLSEKDAKCGDSPKDLLFMLLVILKHGGEWTFSRPCSKRMF